MEEAILSEDDHVRADDLSIIYVKRATSGSDLPALERGSRRIYRSPQKEKKKKKYVHEKCFHLNLLFLLVSEITGRESLDRDML